MCPRDLRYMPVYRFEPMLITPPDHPLAHKADLRLEDLSPYGLILPPKRLTTYRLVDLVFQQNRVPYTVALEVGGWEVIKQYVAMGLGISIVTAICLTDADRTRLAARSLRAVLPVAQLRRGGAQGQVPVAAGARVHRTDPARCGRGALRTLSLRAAVRAEFAEAIAQLQPERGAFVTTELVEAFAVAGGATSCQWVKMPSVSCALTSLARFQLSKVSSRCMPIAAPRYRPASGPSAM